MRRRWLMLWFGNTIASKDRIPKYGEFISNRESPQIFNWAMAGAKRLYQNKEFTKTKMGVKLATEMFTDTDSLSSFLADTDVIAIADPVSNTKKDVKVLRAGLYATYKQWCEQTHQPSRRILTKTRLNQVLIDKGFELAKSSGKFYWSGIKLVIN